MEQEQIDAFPESIREWDEIKNSDTPEIFWDRMTNMRTKIGTGLYQPGEDADGEAWDKFASKATELSSGRLIPKPDFENPEQSDNFYSSIGRPEEAKGYEFEDIDGANNDEDRQAFLRKVAFESGLTKAQLKTMDSKIRKADMEAQTAYKEQVTEAVKELKQEWGMAFDDRQHQARKVVEVFMPNLAKDVPLSAGELKAFYSIAKQLGTNSTEFNDQGRQSNQSMTPDEAATKISEMRNNKGHPYNNPQDPAHAGAKKKMRQFYQIKNGIAID